MSTFELALFYAFAVILIATGISTGIWPVEAWRFFTKHFNGWERVQFTKKDTRLVSRFIGSSCIVVGIFIAVMTYFDQWVS